MDREEILSSWGNRKREQIENYSAYVEEGLVNEVDSPFDEIVEQTILGSESFVDRIKREYLLRRCADRSEEPSLLHLQRSFSFEEVIKHVAAAFKVEPECILKRTPGFREARRLAMGCVGARGQTDAIDFLRKHDSPDPM